MAKVFEQVSLGATVEGYFAGLLALYRIGVVAEHADEWERLRRWNQHAEQVRTGNPHRWRQR